MKIGLKTYEIEITDTNVENRASLLAYRDNVEPCPVVDTGYYSGLTFGVKPCATFGKPGSTLDSPFD
jgi:hypothetical protein